MKYFIADTHFLDKHMIGNKNFAPRPYFFVDEMDNDIIKNWNEEVSDSDIVYHLGDIAVCHEKPQRKAHEKIYDILKQLNGQIIFIKGNHDSRALFKFIEKNNYELNGKPKYSFHDVGALIKMNHAQYYMTHYPLMMGQVGPIIDLHGHIHHYSVPVKENINVGVDSPEKDYLGYEKPFGAPFSEQDIFTMVEQKKIDFAKRR